MTPEDKVRIEEIRKSWINGVEPVPFLLAQLDETSTRLASAHAALLTANEWIRQLYFPKTVPTDTPFYRQINKALGEE